MLEFVKPLDFTSHNEQDRYYRPLPKSPESIRRDRDMMIINTFFTPMTRNRVVREIFKCYEDLDLDYLSYERLMYKCLCGLIEVDNSILNIPEFTGHIPVKNLNNYTGLSTKTGTFISNLLSEERFNKLKKIFADVLTAYPTDSTKGYPKPEYCDKYDKGGLIKAITSHMVNLAEISSEFNEKLLDVDDISQILYEMYIVYFWLKRNILGEVIPDIKSFISGLPTYSSDPEVITKERINEVTMSELAIMFKQSSNKSYSTLKESIEQLQTLQHKVFTIFNNANHKEQFEGFIGFKFAADLKRAVYKHMTNDGELIF